MTALRRGYPQNISTSTSSPAARSTERNDMESWTMKSTCLSLSWISWEQRASQKLWRYHFNCKTTDSAWFNSHRLPAFMALIRPAAACLPISKVGTRLSWPYWASQDNGFSIHKSIKTISLVQSIFRLNARRATLCARYEGLGHLKKRPVSKDINVQNWDKWVFGSVAQKPELLLYCDSLVFMQYFSLFTSFWGFSYHFDLPSALPSAPAHSSPPKPRSLRPAGLKPPPQHWRPTSGRSCSGHAVPGGDLRSLRKLKDFCGLKSWDFTHVKDDF